MANNITISKDLYAKILQAVGLENTLDVITEKMLIDGLQVLQTSIINHNETVKQNRNLQQQINENTFNRLGWNDGQNINFGEFVLKRYSWCSFLNDILSVGFIDVEYIADKHRKIYVGIGQGSNFNDDVLNIAKYGQCVRDGGYAE